MGAYMISKEQRAANLEKARATAKANREARRAAEAAIEQQAEVAVILTSDSPPPLEELISDERIAQIYAKAKLDHLKKQREQKEKEIYQEAMLELDREAGMIPPETEMEEWLAQEAEIYITLPALRQPNGREVPRDPILIDGKPFHHGRSYKVPLAQALYLSDVMSRMRQHVAQVDGRHKNYYNEQTGQMVYMGGTARGGVPGLSFDALHKRPN